MKMRTVLALLLATLLLTMAHANVASATVWYVDNNARPGGTGLSWPAAFSAVQGGINAAVSGDEVWVKRGTYYENISMKDGVALYGGFADNMSTLTQRNPKLFVTIIDGNHAGSVVTILDCPSRSTVLDGFTVRNGSGTFSEFYTMGGGIFSYDNSSPTITNNVIKENAAGYGGGIFFSNNYKSNPIIENNYIVENKAEIQGGGGGIYVGNLTNAVIKNNIISKNNGIYGGGIYLYNNSSTIIGNTISQNNATTGTGWSYGGGIYLATEGTTVIANNIVALCNSGIYSDGGTAPMLSHNNVFGNTAYNYSAVSPGFGDISADPLFIDTTVGDYHLRVGSPCVDAGDNSAVLDNTWVDIDGEPRIQKGISMAPYATVDIGADELDTRPPVTSVSQSGTSGTNGWYVSAITVTLSATDAWIDNTIPVKSPGTGVAYTQYSLDGINWTVYTGPFILSANGQYLVDYRSADMAGNVEAIRQLAVKIDTVAPATVSTSPANGKTGVLIGTPIGITFSESVQPGSAYGGITVKKGTTPLSYTPGISGSVLTLTPVGTKWPKNSTIRVTVPAGAVKDLAGNPTTSATTFSFTTGNR